MTTLSLCMRKLDVNEPPKVCQERLSVFSVYRLRLYNYCGSVAQHFGNPAHDFGCIVADANHGIRAKVPRMSHHRFKCIITRFFAQLGKQSDISTSDGLQRGAERPK